MNESQLFSVFITSDLVSNVRFLERFPPCLKYSQQTLTTGACTSGNVQDGGVESLFLNIESVYEIVRRNNLSESSQVLLTADTVYHALPRGGSKLSTPWMLHWIERDTMLVKGSCLKRLQIRYQPQITGLPIKNLMYPVVLTDWKQL